MFDMQLIMNDFEIKGLNSIYYFEFGKNHTHTLEKHNFWEMVYVDSGSIFAFSEGERFELNQGQAIFHEPYESHAHISNPQSHNNMVVLCFTCDSEAMNFFRKKIFTFDKTSKTILQLFMNEAKNALGTIPYEYNNKNNLDFSNAKFGSTQLLMCYLVELLINISRTNNNFENNVSFKQVSRSMTHNSIGQLIEEYLKNNVYSNLTMEDICSVFMIGKSQLSHIYKTNFGTSIMESYNRMIITEAKKLLREEELSISQISDKLNFSSIHCFSRAFKKIVGVSPTDYKRRINS